MNLASAEALFVELAALTPAAQTEVGSAGRPPRTHAYLKLSSRTDPDRFAIVSTPGVGTFELEAAGGFSTGHADDQATDDDVRGYVEFYLRAACAYLDGRWSIRKSRIFRVPVLTIHTDAGPLNLSSRGWPSINRF